MRIISNHRDYYDCMQSYYQDNLTYIRNRKEITDKEYPWNLSYFDRVYHLRNEDNLLSNFCYSRIVIGFCGKEYTCYKIAKNNLNVDDGVCCYSKSDIEKYLGKDVANQIVKYLHKWHNEEFLVSKECHSKFIQYKAPIFAEYKETLVINECLKDLNFQRIFPPQFAYQELMMYFNSVLAEPEKQIPKIDDVTMAQAKGFDKFSFRKDKRG